MEKKNNSIFIVGDQNANGSTTIWKPGNTQPFDQPESFQKYRNIQIPRYIKPSQMEVAPLHRTLVIRHKRRLFKNTKGI